MLLWQGRAPTVPRGYANAYMSWAQKGAFSPELREERRKAYAEAKRKKIEKKQKRTEEMGEKIYDILYRLVEDKSITRAEAKDELLQIIL